MRKKAHAAGLWLPHMPTSWGGMGLGHVQLAMVQAEAAKASYGPWVLNCQAPDEGNMHTLLHWGTDAQKEKYLKPLCQGEIFGATGVTEPHSGTDIVRRMETTARREGDHYVLNGTKIWISNARNADFFLTYATIDKIGRAHV